MSQSFYRIGWFAAVTLVSAVAFGQAEGEPAAAPAAAAPAAAAAQPIAVERAKPAVAPRAVPRPVKAKAALETKTAAEKTGLPKNGAKTPPDPVMVGRSTETAAAPAAVGQPVTPSPAIQQVAPAPEGVPPAAQEQGHARSEAEPSDVGAHERHHAHRHGPAQVNESEASEHGEHAAAHHESEEPPTIDDVNWYYGLLGESDEGEPNLLYRKKGMPVPFLATLINWGILVALIVMVARKQLPAALAKRKATIVQGMQEAKKLRDESAERLREYEDKLARIDSDIERIKESMRKAGEQERDRILAEAVERRTRMERDARRLIETEIEATKESLRREVVRGALLAAKQSVENQVADNDQQRLFDEAMASLQKLPARSLGGQA